MATLIPVLGEMLPIAPPQSRLGVDALISGSVPVFQREVWMSTLGEAFICANPFGVEDSALTDYVNTRAKSLMDTRRIVLQHKMVYGSVLYMSKSEWDGLIQNEAESLPDSFDPTSEPPPVGHKLVAIYGDTYPFRVKIKKDLHGKWDSKSRLWFVPQYCVAEALTLLLVAESSQPSATQKEGLLRIAKLFSNADKLVSEFSSVRRANYSIAEAEYSIFLAQTGAYDAKKKEQDAHVGSSGRIKRNKKDGKCHLCNDPIPVGKGSVVFAPRTVTFPGGWTVECSPRGSCKGVIPF
jgi:hypothetical protein